MAQTTEEWDVLQSIHPSICIANDSSLLTLLVPVELGHDRQVLILPVPHDDYHSLTAMPTVTPSQSASLSTLPPLHLRISLPPRYPSQEPPIIQSLQSTSAWIPPAIISLMKDRMIAMWSPDDDSGVLYTWVEWIRTGDFLADLGLLAEDMHSIQIPHPSPHLLLPPLLAHASSSKSDEFAHTSYQCAICLSERKGIHCLSLSCGHVFCRSCLVDMWGLHVREGQVSRVGCPDLECGKGETKESDGLREATEEEVRAVLSEQELDRWKWLRRKRDLERDPLMIHCPMEFCQEPVPKPASDKARIGNVDEDESGWARLRTCSSCSYSFCAFCRRTWHGPHTPCMLSLTSQFILNYLSAPPDSAERHAIEHRYGRVNVLKLVKTFEEEQENRKWMDASTTTCPGCAVRVQKSQGCNHMICSKCSTHFCYRCGSKIPAADPYQHFSTPHTSCFSKLFDPVPSDEDEWQPVAGFELI